MVNVYLVNVSMELYYKLWNYGKYEILDEKSAEARKFHAEFLEHKAAYQKLYRKNMTKYFESKTSKDFKQGWSPQCAF